MLFAAQLSYEIYIMMRFRALRTSFHAFLAATRCLDEMSCFLAAEFMF
jgi:hypothetical protein